MDEGTVFFQSIEKTSNSPLAKRLFGVDGVTGVFFGSDFITITKNDSLDWQVMKPAILGSIMDHFNSGELTINNETSDDGKMKMVDVRMRPFSGQNKSIARTTVSKWQRELGVEILYVLHDSTIRWEDNL